MASALAVVAVCLGVRFAIVDEPARLGPPGPSAPASAPPASAREQAAAAPRAAPRSGPWRDGSSLTRAKDFWTRSAIEALLEQGGDVNARGGAVGRTPLQFAARYDFAYRDPIIPLLEAGADPFARDLLGEDALSGLLTSSQKPPLAQIRAIVERARPPQDFGVIDLIRRGDRAGLARRLADATSLEERWDLERTPLLWAVYYDQQEIALDLLRRGARLDVRDYRRDTPLHFAAMNGDVELAQKFIAAGAKLDAVNGYGQTPLAQSLFAPDTRMMQYLLDRGADPCLGPRGRSDVLHLARTTATDQAAAAVKLLEPAVARRGCRERPEEAMRRGFRELTVALQKISPPPREVRDASPDDPDLATPEHARAAARRLGLRAGATRSVEEYERLVEEEGRLGYRALLAYPEDGPTVVAGIYSAIPDRRREDLDTALRLWDLLVTHLFYYRDPGECPLCDPGEFIRADSAAIWTRDYFRENLRRGRILAPVDLCEKFIRERIGETRYRYLVYKTLVRALWLLGRSEEALEIGEAELARTYGPDPARHKNKLGWMVRAVREASEAPGEPPDGA